MVHDCCLSKPILLLFNGLVAFCCVLYHRQKQIAPPYGPLTRIAEEIRFFGVSMLQQATASPSAPACGFPVFFLSEIQPKSSKINMVIQIKLYISSYYVSTKEVEMRALGQIVGKPCLPISAAVRLTLFYMFVKIAGRNGQDAPFSFPEGDD